MDSQVVVDQVSQGSYIVHFLLLPMIVSVVIVERVIVVFYVGFVVMYH